MRPSFTALPSSGRRRRLPSSAFPAVNDVSRDYLSESRPRAMPFSAQRRIMERRRYESVASATCLLSSTDRLFLGSDFSNASGPGSRFFQRNYYKQHLNVEEYCSCSVAANHEALSRLRHGSKSHREHHSTFLCWLFCGLFAVRPVSDSVPCALGSVRKVS